MHIFSEEMDGDGGGDGAALWALAVLVASRLATMKLRRKYETEREEMASGALNLYGNDGDSGGKGNEECEDKVNGGKDDDHDWRSLPVQEAEKRKRRTGLSSSKEERYARLLPKLIMQKPMYDNISMTAKSGTFLCTISRKKSQWYINKGLAEDDGSGGIRLRFDPKEPSHLSADDRRYIMREKVNACVVCGESTKGYMRHYIVPGAYRTLFPKRFKSHLSQDIVILCPDCHVKVQGGTGKEITRWDRTLATHDRYVIDRGLLEVRNAAIALIKYRAKMPEEIVEKHQSTVCHWAGVEASEPTPDILLRASTLDFKSENPRWRSGAQLIVERLDTDEKMGDFIRGWRRFFVALAKPRFMPDGWSIDGAVTNGNLVDLRGDMEDKRKTNDDGRDIEMIDTQ